MCQGIQSFVICDRNLFQRSHRRGLRYGFRMETMTRAKRVGGALERNASQLRSICRIDLLSRTFSIRLSWGSQQKHLCRASSRLMHSKTSIIHIKISTPEETAAQNPPLWFRTILVNFGMWSILPAGELQWRIRGLGSPWDGRGSLQIRRSWTKKGEAFEFDKPGYIVSTR